MIQYIVRRLLLAVPVVIGITFLTFGMLLATGDPTSAMAGEHASPALRAAIREELGLDDPLPVQYGRFLGRLIQGDLGRSVMTRIPVQSELKLFFPATI